MLARLTERLLVRPAIEVPFDPTTRMAAVAAILRVTAEPELLFIKRAELDGDPWSGHMAFPGGRHEPSDTDLRDTAVRETQEETALDLERGGRVLGVLDDLAPVSARLPRIMIRPYVAVVSADAVIVPSEEVATHFWVPLDTLRAPEMQAEHELVLGDVRQRFPGYRVGPHIAWGLTERILRQLLGLLDP